MPSLLEDPVAHRSSLRITSRSPDHVSSIAHDLRVHEPERQRDLADDVLGHVGRRRPTRAWATPPRRRRRARSPRAGREAAGSSAARRVTNTTARSSGALARRLTVTPSGSSPSRSGESVGSAGPCDAHPRLQAELARQRRAAVAVRAHAVASAATPAMIAESCPPCQAIGTGARLLDHQRRARDRRGVRLADRERMSGVRLVAVGHDDDGHGDRRELAEVPERAASAAPRAARRRRRPGARGRSGAGAAP